MSSLDKSIVYISSVYSVQNFCVVKEENLLKPHRITQRLEEREEDFINANVDCRNLKVGDVVLASANSREYGKFFRSRVTNLNSLASSATVLHIDTGKLETVPFSSLFMLPKEMTIDVMPALAISNCKLRCFAPCEKSKQAFIAVTATKKLMLRVLKEEDDSSLEVDLFIYEDEEVDLVQPVSVRDILVFTARAEFDISRFSVIPNFNHYNFTLLPLLKAGDKREVFVSHVPKIVVDNDIMLYVQIVSRLSLKLPNLSKNMAKKYKTGDPLLHDLVGFGSFSEGMCCAVGDEEGGWFRAVITKTGENRMVTVRYVDFGNEETVNSHKLRRLHGKFRRMPCLAVPVFIPLRVKYEEDAKMLEQELACHVKYTEMKLSVLEVSREGKQTVNLDFLFGSSLQDFIIELLK